MLSKAVCGCLLARIILLRTKARGRFASPVWLHLATINAQCFSNRLRSMKPKQVQKLLFVRSVCRTAELSHLAVSWTVDLTAAR